MPLAKELKKHNFLSSKPGKDIVTFASHNNKWNKIEMRM